MANEEKDRLYREGKQVVILDAAVLIVAGWHEKCDEVVNHQFQYNCISLQRIYRIRNW